MQFEWDGRKDAANRRKHGVSFGEAQRAFLDPKRLIATDSKHSTESEARYFCFGLVGDRVLTVRFTMRDGRVRIFGAGYWRQGRKRYEER